MIRVAWVFVMVSVAIAGNPIADENAKPGNPGSQWDITGAGDPGIQGFATEISVNHGEIVRFKVNTTATSYRLDIYRLGYYNGLGARLVTTVYPSVGLPQTQPAPITDAETGLVDCGNWQVSASWLVPATAVSGVYIAKIVRPDTGGASHIIFVVRDDASASPVVFQTSDTTWQAYNSYGGNSLYKGSPAGRAYKVSYNRPFNTRSGQTSFDWFFNSEYPMVRWLEANGYDVTYTTGVDSDRRGSLLTNHKVFLSVGHDEYWSANQRRNVEAARAAGVHLAFFSANECFWKIRWEPSTDSSKTPWRTMVCYKETLANAKIDPDPAWTGTWRDPRFSPPADGGRPENSMTGTLFRVNGYLSRDSIRVDASFGKHWFWENTGVDKLGPAEYYLSPSGTLGYEWDVTPDDQARPPGLMYLSSTTIGGLSLLVDYGSTYQSGTATHQLALYRHSSGAWVFGSGTIQWPWGLDDQHDNSISAASSAMRQATVNLLGKMGVQPETLQPGLVRSQESTDFTAPASSIGSPLAGDELSIGNKYLIQGTAADLGGKVWSVEVSVDGGVSWKIASGAENWSWEFSPGAPGSVRILSRAVDVSGNLEIPGSGVLVNVVSTQRSVWENGEVPKLADAGADNPVEVGVKFRSDVAGSVLGIRYYKSAANIGPHVISLWNLNGTLLARATADFGAATGWQQVNFASPVAINANTVYVASYHANTGHYAGDLNFFSTKGVDNVPLHLLANGVSGGNGVYAYGTNSVFPTKTYYASNYWVDVAFKPSSQAVLQRLEVAPALAHVYIGGVQQFSATGYYSDGSVVDLSGRVGWSSGNTSVAGVDSSGLATGIARGEVYISATLTGITAAASLHVEIAPLTIQTASLPDGNLNGFYSTSLVSNGGLAPMEWSVIQGGLPAGISLDPASGTLSGVPSEAGVFSFTVQVRDSGNPVDTAQQPLVLSVSSLPAVVSIWDSSVVPGVVDSGPDKAVELGVKFRSDVDGYILGVRYFKAFANTGTHTGRLWTSSGTSLASATFVESNVQGWTEVRFASPVKISANVTYIASYFTSVGHYSLNTNYFATSGVDRPPLHALSNAAGGGNGVFRYGANGGFPNRSSKASNYWVDVVFQPASAVAPLAINTSSLPAGTINSVYSATLVAIGGTAPYRWSLTSGALPAGLALNTSTGEITGIPTVPGSFSFNIAASDSGSPAQSATKSMVLDILPADSSVSIWDLTAVPTVADGGPDSPVELGMKFRSDIAGYVTGVRFYKAATNTGLHVANLWSNNQVLLATADFTAETASGWQEVSFSSPVPISANTVYVVSYHSMNGHYAADAGYFGNGGVDRAPLHALADGESGGNGVYRYGSTSGFPSLSWKSANYWVDVVFRP